MGGKIAQSVFDAFECSLKEGRVDTNDLGRLVRQQMGMKSIIGTDLRNY